MAAAGDTWHLPAQNREYPRDFHISVHNFRKDAGCESVDHYRLDQFFNDSQLTAPAREGMFTWFHLPANHMGWVERFFDRYDSGAYRLDPRAWTHLLRPDLHGTIDPPIHATHMLPRLTSTYNNIPNQPIHTLYLPYLNWEKYIRYSYLYASYTGRRWPFPIALRAGHRPHESAIKFMSALFENQRRDRRPLHPRRTLDQFAYPSLVDSTVRDADQTVSKWTSERTGKEGTKTADASSRLIMVDQLWCWVLDDRTILSAFPSHDAQYSDSGFSDLYKCMRDDLDYCYSARKLFGVMTTHAATYLLDPKIQQSLDLIRIYQWVMGKKVADQTTLFGEFQESSARGAPSFDDRHELSLIQDVADMNDELGMIKRVIEEQMNVLGPFYDNGTNEASEYSGYVRKVTDNANQAIAEMRDTAERTRSLLIQQLDIEQKSATLSEARSTTQQGRAVMLFTIVTVIFLPLSFFTSYFGQNVSEITGDDQNPSSWKLWKVGMPISLVIILFALLAAFLITRRESPLKTMRDWNTRRRRDDIELAEIRIARAHAPAPAPAHSPPLPSSSSTFPSNSPSNSTSRPSMPLEPEPPATSPPHSNPLDSPPLLK